MTPTQVSALEKFLANNNFNYYDYNEEVGAVVYGFVAGDWIMEVAYGDDCYYRLYNDITEECNCDGFTDVSEVMIEYHKLLRLLKQKLCETQRIAR